MQPVKLGDTGVYEVERAVTKRQGLSLNLITNVINSVQYILTQSSQTEFLILWKGFPKESASWVKYSEVTPEVIRYGQT